MVLLLASTLAREDADPEAEELAAELPLAAELLLDAELLHAARSTAAVTPPSTTATRLGRIEDPIKPPLDCFVRYVTTVPVRVTLSVSLQSSQAAYQTSC